MNWNEAFVAYFKALFKHVPDGTDLKQNGQSQVQVCCNLRYTIDAIRKFI
jgi:hypothetical protein